MNKFLYTNVLIALLLFSSWQFSFCAELVEARITEGLANVRLSPDDGYLDIGLKTPTLDPVKQGFISEKESFAISGTGKRFGIIVNPNEYARNFPERSYFTSDFVWLKGDHGEKLDWKHGDWKLALVLQTPKRKVTYRATFVLLKAKPLSLFYLLRNFNGDF